MERKGILKIYAPTSGGIQLEGTGEWINATTTLKNNIINKVIDYTHLKGKPVIVKLDDKGFYTEVILDVNPSAQTIQQNIRTTKALDSRARTHPNDSLNMIRMNCLTQSNSLVSTLFKNVKVSGEDFATVEELVFRLAEKFEKWVCRKETKEE